jgi:FkbM family methyltransferase
VGKRLAPGKQLVMVEANPLLIESLQANVGLNLDPAQVHVEHGAVSYSGATVLLSIDESVLGSSVSSGSSRMGAGVREVPSLRLGDVLSRHRLGDYVLISDIEGMEHELIEEEPEALAQCRQIIIEVHDSYRNGVSCSGRDVVTKLVAMGFEVRSEQYPVFVMERAA